MCKAPKPPAPKEPDKPQYLRNPYLDAQIGGAAAVNQLRTGRSQLRIDLDSGLGIRQPSTPNTTPRGPANPPRPSTPNPLDRLRPRLPTLAAL